MPFLSELDDKPITWEDRLTLFVGYLIKEKRKSTTVCSYISAIKAVLLDEKIELNEDRCLLTSLTRACKLNNDVMRLKLPIQKDMLKSLVFHCKEHFLNLGQEYLASLYAAMLSVCYFGMLRISEVTHSQHVVKVVNVHVGSNKQKILFVLHSSKTHGKGQNPQQIKLHRDFVLDEDTCPFLHIQNYLSYRSSCKSVDEQFFIFQGRIPVKDSHFRSELYLLIK